jgi:hypothetical protein
VSFDRKTRRTVRREVDSRREISRLLISWARSSKIVLRCAWLNMRLFLRAKFFVQSAQLVLNALHLVLGGLALMTV